MKFPLLYEINTRCWLGELSDTSRANITLANVPDPEFARWPRLGFTHVWLMGVWPTGLRSRAISRALPGCKKNGAESLPHFSDRDIAGSPYAIADYKISGALGGETGLTKFRQKLAARGLKLVLDFVSNHTGLDHRWLDERPELFVQSSTESPDTFFHKTPVGGGWIAHGKDPYFPGWADTAQLDYRNPATRAAVIEELTKVAPLCDGVRCDMAMLALNDVFAKTWERFPSPYPAPETEFWTEAIQAVKRIRPDFVFIAEAYWDLEARLQDLGFDFVYDKRLYDYLVSRNYADAQRHLLALTPRFLEASVHFLENHDEPRIASLLSWPEHRAALLAILGLPGLRLLHEGQLTGATKHVSVHLGRRSPEPLQPEITAYYERLLTTLAMTTIGRGRGALSRPMRAWADNPTAENFVIIQWQDQAPGFELVVVNLAPHDSQCYAPLAIPRLEDYNWEMKNLLGEEIYERRGDDLQRQGLYLDVPGHGAQLFHFQPIL